MFFSVPSYFSPVSFVSKYNLNHHRTPRRGSHGPNHITDSQSHGLSPGGTAGRAAQGGATGGSGVDGGTGGGPGPAGTLNTTGGKDRGLAHGAAVHSEWHRAGGPGVA